jgi:hypothetical protein
MIGMHLVEVRHGESFLHNIVNINFGRVKQFTDMFVPLRLMKSAIVP